MPNEHTDAMGAVIWVRSVANKEAFEFKLRNHIHLRFHQPDHFVVFRAGGTVGDIEFPETPNYDLVLTQVLSAYSTAHNFEVTTSPFDINDHDSCGPVFPVLGVAMIQNPPDGTIWAFRGVL